MKNGADPGSNMKSVWEIGKMKLNPEWKLKHKCNESNMCNENKYVTEAANGV